MAGDNTRIAKNTVYLYIRTGILIIVSLYTSRIVLETLGVDDYGIYNVMAGIITLMGFFQAAQSKSTSRFITYELGSNGIGESLGKVFRAALSIHILAAIAGLIICETIGLYIAIHWTSIPPDKVYAAHIVYQFAIFTFCIHILRIPYDSVVVAHEQMSMYAYLSIIEALLQLGLVFIVKSFPENALIVYSFLMCLSALIVFLLYYIFVRCKYPIYRFRYTWDSKLSKSMLSFSGWTLLGAGANAGTQQGVNLLMNNFVGLMANAAIGLSSQVNAAVSKFVTSFSTAFTPQIIKLYACEDFNSLNKLINRSSKFSFALCYLFALPLIYNMDFILHIWLGDNVPEYTAAFCSVILICTLIDATTGVYNTAVTATGKIKIYQILISGSFCLDLIISAILLYNKINPVLVFYSRIFTRGILNMAIGLSCLNIYIGFDVGLYFKSVIFNILLTILITLPVVYIVGYFTSDWVRLILTTLSSAIILGLCVFTIIMSADERRAITNLIRKKIVT